MKFDLDLVSIDDFDVTSRHVTSSDVASYRRCGHVLTSWASIDHRKQMWCQML